MLPVHFTFALDLARQRAREASEVRLADLAQHGDPFSRPERPGLVRRLLARAAARTSVAAAVVAARLDAQSIVDRPSRAGHSAPAA